MATYSLHFWPSDMHVRMCAHTYIHMCHNSRARVHTYMSTEHVGGEAYGCELGGKVENTECLPHTHIRDCTCFLVV